MIRRSFLTLVTLVSFIATCSANPVPDHVAQDFRVLVASTTRAGRCPDSERLVGHFSRFGLDLLDEQHVRSMAAKFDVFGPLLVRSQEPGRSLNFQVQEFYRKHALSQARTQMTEALRGWLTDSIEGHHRGGMVRVDLSQAERDARDDRARAKAAEMLSEWRDAGATPLIRAVLERPDLDEEARTYLSASLGRLEDPCHWRFLRLNPAGRLRVCCDRGDLVSAHWGRNGEALGDEQIDRIFALLRRSESGENSNWTRGPHVLVVELGGGLVANLSPTEPGRITYTDNSSQNQRRRLTLENEELHGLLTAIAPER